MRKSIIRQVLTASLLLSAAPPYLHGQACPDAARLTAGMKGPMATVRYLSDDALEGRLAGSPAERCAGDFIAQRFKALGLKPAGDAGSYFQNFALASVVADELYNTPIPLVAVSESDFATLRTGDRIVLNEVGKVFVNP